MHTSDWNLANLAIGSGSMIDEAVASAIERRASLAREEHGIPGPPDAAVSVRRLARAVGVRRVAAVRMESEGRMSAEEGRGLSIYYRDGMSNSRSTFTIAHELGHLFLERRSSKIDLGPAEVEAACNIFAAELLMPRSWISDEFGQQTPSLEALRSVAKAAGVSLAASLARLRAVENWRTQRSSHFDGPAHGPLVTQSAPNGFRRREWIFLRRQVTRSIPCDAAGRTMSGCR